MDKPRPRLVVLFLLISFFLLTGSNSALAAEKTKVKFAVDWIIHSGHSPWFLALSRGFYEEQGLEVSVSRGYGAGPDEIKRLAAGERNLGFVDPMAVVVARSQGVRIKLLAVIYERGPMVIFSLKKTGIKALADLEGRSLGLSPGGVERLLFPVLAKLNNVKLERVNIINIDPAQKFPMLIAEKVDSITLYAHSAPEVEKASASQGGYNMIAFADYGLDLYSNSVAATDDYVRENPDTIRKFMRASIKGWEYARDHPEEAVEAVLKVSPTLDRELSRKRLAVTLEHVFSEGTNKYGLGFMTKEKMGKTRDLTVQVYQIKQPVKLEELYTNEYLK